MIVCRLLGGTDLGRQQDGDGDGDQRERELGVEGIRFVLMVRGWGRRDGESAGSAGVDGAARGAGVCGAGGVLASSAFSSTL